MNWLNVSCAAIRSQRIRRTTVIGLGCLFSLGLANPVRASNTTQVTGQTSDTAAGDQAETFCTTSTVGANVVQSIAYNDNTGETPAFVQYPPPPAGSPPYSPFSGRIVFPGFAAFGWSYRVLGPSGPGPWTHALFQTPQSIGWDVVWGDPSIASNDGLPGFVFAGTLAMPHDKFTDVANLRGTPGFIQGLVTPIQTATQLIPSPVGGGCVYRSTDGGQSFAIVDCVRDTSNVNGPDDSYGHFYDGSSMAVAESRGGGGKYSAYIAFIDTEVGRQAVWTMIDATSNAAHPFQPDSTVVGNVGPLAGEELGDIDTHVRLVASGSDLWEMSARPSATLVNAAITSFGFSPADLEVNIRERNANSFSVAENAETGLGVELGKDAMGRPLSLRTGPQFAFDVGLNERGQPEMRFVYVAIEVDAATQNVTNSYLQAGYCATDLSNCSRPIQWRTAVNTLPNTAPSAYFPAIKYGVAPVTGAPSWKVTWQQLNGQQVAIFAADLQRPNLVPGSATFSGSGLTVTQESAYQTPCPDLRSEMNGGDQYWGDYDGMTYVAKTGSFLRAFTDSSMGTGCDSRGPLTAHNVHVSEVDLDALGAPREAVVTLSNLRFGTTGFNVCSPSDKAQTINGEDANGNIVIKCDPLMNPDGTVSPVVVNVPPDECSCGDGHGALINVSCGGTGAPGSVSLNVNVTISIEQNCASLQEDTSNAGTAMVTNLLPDSPQSYSLFSCDEFGSSTCANGGACVFNSFDADVSVSNVNAL